MKILISVTRNTSRHSDLIPHILPENETSWHRNWPTSILPCHSYYGISCPRTPRAKWKALARRPRLRKQRECGRERAWSSEQGAPNFRRRELEEGVNNRLFRRSRTNLPSVTPLSFTTKTHQVDMKITIHNVWKSAYLLRRSSSQGDRVACISSFCMNKF